MVVTAKSEKIKWESEATHALLNPKLPLAEKQDLDALSQEFSQKGHIWIASSGSSTEPGQSVKLIALSKKAFLVSAQAVNQHLQSQATDVWLQALPRFHVGGLSIEARCYLSGASLVSGLNKDKWDPHFFQERLKTEKVTLTALVPTQIHDLLRENFRAPPGLRVVVVGGSALSESLYQQATDLGWPLLPSYGLTECCSQVATAALDSWKRKNPELQLLSHIRAETTKEGRLRIQSEALLTGFARRVKGQSHWQDPKIQGWYLTEDFCELQNGILTPQGRGSDFVKVSGEGVNLLKLQKVLETVIQKFDANWFGLLILTALPHSRTGNEITLVGTQEVPAEFLEAVQNEFNRQVAPYERATSCRRVLKIPRTELGKVSQAQLKALLLS